MPPKKYYKKNNDNFLPFKIFNTNQKIDKKTDYTICAIDPALKNCAIRIEGPDKKTIFQEKFKFVESSKDKNLSYEEIIRVFKKIKKELSICDFIIIECQHQKNKDMLKVGQTIITCLLMMFQNVEDVIIADEVVVIADDKIKKSPLIIEVEARIKSSRLYMKEEGVETKMKKPELKKWSSKKGLEMLEKNNDYETLNRLKKEKKLDDHGDVILYTHCWRECFIKDDKWNKYFLI